MAWLAGAIYYESRAPAERTRSWLGSTMPIGLVIITVVSVGLAGSPRPQRPAIVS